jgi:ABC-2 type transport system permease protein
MAMAGTDNRHQHHFVRAAEEHRRRIQTATSQDLIDNAKPGATDYAAPADLWRRIPAFSYSPPAAAWAWQTQGRNLGALALWSLACTAAAMWAARRLRPL